MFICGQTLSTSLICDTIIFIKWCIILFVYYIANIQINLILIVFNKCIGDEIMIFNEEDINKYIVKWQDTLRLRDWDIKHEIVNTEWRKTGDIKIDADDKKVILLINNYNPKQTNLEALIIHELLHLKLWGMDQMIEGLIYSVFGQDENDPKLNFAYSQFMTLLESTVEDLSKSFVKLGAEDKEISFGRVQKQVDKELGRG